MNKKAENQCNRQIRSSTDSDLQEILNWLSKQDKIGIEGTFYCNRNLTIQEHNKGKLIVCIDPATDQPVAYQWGGLISPGILEVRADKRGQGIGKELVEYRIKEARENDKCLLRIQCTPITSIPFWKHMGFQLYGRNENDAYMLLDKKFDLPKDGDPCILKICFYPEERNWKEDTVPIKIFTPLAIKKADNFIYLSERVSYFHISNKFDNDPVISININGEQVYLDKAKYEHAQELGVQMDGSAFYIDMIETKNT